jgi:hypothetical protein
MRTHLFTAIALGLLAAACQPSDQTLASATSSEQVCGQYGFIAGLPAWDRCVERERAVRASGHVSPDSSEARLTDDARNACASYGVQPNSPHYNKCISHETDVRRDEAQAAAPAGRTDQYGNRIDRQG